MLEQHGRIHVDRAAEEAKLKMPMVCPLTGIALDGIDAVKKHVRSSAYRDAISETYTGAHLVTVQGRCANSNVTECRCHTKTA